MPVGNVRDAHRGVGGVDVLAAGAGGAIGVDAHVLLVDLDVDVVVDRRIDPDGGEAGVPARVGIEGRDAHQPVHAAFGLQPAIGIVALDQHGGRLDAGLFAGMLADDLDLVAVRFGPAHVHALAASGPSPGSRCRRRRHGFRDRRRCRRPRPTAAPRPRACAPPASSLASAASASATMPASSSSSPSSISVTLSSSSRSMRSKALSEARAAGARASRLARLAELFQKFGSSAARSARSTAFCALIRVKDASAAGPGTA